MKNNVFNMKAAEKLVKQLFGSLNISLQAETPARFIKMMKELTSCQNISNQEISNTVNKLFATDEQTSSRNIVIVKNIDAFSLCEHHIALMYDMKIAVAYIPNKQILGLSKVVRLVTMVCKRLQLQEKIGTDIIEIMSILTKSNDVAVHIKAKHSCVTARGIQNVSSSTETINFSGVFLENEAMQSLFINKISC